MSTVILAFVALFPSIVLMVYIYKKDKVEKEPAGLLALLFVLGALSSVPTIFAEQFAENLFQSILQIGILDDGSIVSYAGSAKARAIFYLFIDNFLGVGLVEEGFKFLVLFFATRNNKNFNCLFDGIIYSVFVSLGFATLENVLYTMQYGLSTALIRMVLSVPTHFFFSVIMGIFYSWWKIHSTLFSIEITLKANSLLPKEVPSVRCEPFLVLALGIPVFFHGLFDFGCQMNIMAIPYIITALGYLLIFFRVRTYSKIDGTIFDYCIAFFLKKYPGFNPAILLSIASSISSADSTSSSAGYSSGKPSAPSAATPVKKTPSKEETDLDDILRSYDSSNTGYTPASAPANTPKKEPSLNGTRSTYETPKTNRSPAAAPKDSEKDELEQAIDEYIKSLKNSK